MERHFFNFHLYIVHGLRALLFVFPFFSFFLCFLSDLGRLQIQSDGVEEGYELHIVAFSCEGEHGDVCSGQEVHEVYLLLFFECVEEIILLLFHMIIKEYN